MTALAGGLLVVGLLLGLGAGYMLAWRRSEARAVKSSGMLGAMHSEVARQRALFEAAPDGILIFDRDGSILNANPAAHRLFGAEPGSLIGRSGRDTLDPRDHDRAIAGMLDEDNIAAGGLRTEYLGLRADGSTFPMQVSLVYSPPGEDWFAAAFLRDVTRQRDAERMKDEFVSTVSHELRTPLTSIAGSLGLIAGGAVGALPEKAARLISIAQSNSQRLVRLINDVLDVEKLASGSLPFHMVETSLREVATRSIEMTRGYADQLGVELALVGDGEGVQVRGDPDRLVQVLTNLLSNAAKYSPRGDRVEVRIEADGAQARVTVVDRGPGVPEAFRDRIFSRFAQADSSDARGKSGTGLGLYIAREITERHGGRLWYETPPGGGAAFHFEIPQLVDEVSRPSALDRVLLVEDEPAAAAIMSAILEDDGLIVDVAGTLGEARKFLSENGRYGSVVLDLRLPDGDGVDLAKEIRAKPNLAGMPIVVVSADARRGKDPEVRMLEVSDWMEKPVDPDHLTQLVRSALDRVGQRRLILHVDADRDIREVVSTALSEWGEVVSAEGLEEARRAMDRRRPDLVIIDPSLEEQDGAELIEELKRDTDPPPIIVFCSRDPSVEVGASAAAVLVKSRTPLSGLVGTVREQLLAEAGG